MELDIEQMINEFSGMTINNVLRSEWCVVDCQFAPTRANKLIVKELSFEIKNLCSCEALTFVINSPRLYNDRPVHIAEDPLTGIQWDDGHTKLKNVLTLICDLMNHDRVWPVRTIIVADSVQQKEISRLLSARSHRINIINIQDVGFDRDINFTVAESGCTHHGDTYNRNKRWKCSRANVKYMSSWLNKQQTY